MKLANKINAETRVDKAVATQRAEAPTTDLNALIAKYGGVTKIPHEDLVALAVGLSQVVADVKTEATAAQTEEKISSALLSFVTGLDVEMTDAQLAEKLGGGITAFLGAGTPVTDLALEHQCIDEGRVIRSGDRLAVPIVDNGVASVVVLEKTGGFSNDEQKVAGRFAHQASTKRAEANRVWTEDLTSLMTRKAFSPVAKQMTDVALKNETPLHLFFFDIDAFHNYNEKHGHVDANKLLRLVGDQVNNLRSVFPNAIASRYGGEELVVLVPGISDAQAFEFGELLRTQLHRKSSEKLAEGATVSVGISSLADKKNWVELISSGDAQQFRSKGKGIEGVDRNTLADPTSASSPKNQVSMELRKSFQEFATSIGIPGTEADLLLKMPALRNLLSEPRFAKMDFTAILADEGITSLLKSLSLSPTSLDVKALPKDEQQAMAVFEAARAELKRAQPDPRQDLPPEHPAKKAFGIAALGLAQIVHKRFTSIAEGVTQDDRLKRWDQLVSINEVANGKVGNTAFFVDKVIPKALRDPKVLDYLRTHGVSEGKIAKLPKLFAEAARLQTLGECVSATAVLGAPKQLSGDDRRNFVEGMPKAAAKYAESLELTTDPDVLELLKEMRYGEKRGDPVVALFDILNQGAALLQDRPQRKAMPTEKAQMCVTENNAKYAPELASVVAEQLPSWVSTGWSG